MRYVQDTTEWAMRKNTGFYTRKRLGSGIMAMGDDGVRILHAEASGRWDYGDGRRRYEVLVALAGHGRLCRLPYGFDRAFGDFL